MMRIRRKAAYLRTVQKELDAMIESVLAERILTPEEVDALLEFN